MTKSEAGNGSPNPSSAGRQVGAGPARHPGQLPDSGNILLVSRCGYIVELGVGCQPPTAARFPGLPEELLRTCTVIAIVGAHDAHDAASRLTTPKPDGSVWEAGWRSASCWAPPSAARPSSVAAFQPAAKAATEDAAADHTPHRPIPAHVIGSAVIHFAAPNASLSLTSRTEPGGRVIATLRGDLCIASAPALREHLLSLLRPPVSQLIIDLSAVERADASGLAVLVASGRRAGLLGGSLRLAAPSPEVARVLAATGMDRHLDVFATLQAAMAGLRVADNEGMADARR